MVAGEQKFEDKYEGLASLLKPQGGGGTRVSAVPEYIKSKNIQAQAIVVFTDGYVESNIQWDINTPTLWLITHNKSLSIPAGHKQVIYEE
jgi:predicted metal-dependent peptidase